MTRRRRIRLSVGEVNPLAILALVTTFVLVLTNDVTPEAFLLLVTGLAIPAKSGGYQTAEAAPVTAVPVPPEGHAADGGE